MSNNSIQHIRGTLAEHSTYTGRKGEISLITDSTNDRVPTGEVRIHDGATAGGVPIKLGTSSSPLTSDIYLASGSGINFDAYATSGNPSSNLLDDYEEGIWTPSIEGATTAGTASYLSQVGSYTRIGNFVNVSFYINGTFATSPSSPPSGSVVVRGLPFTSISMANSLGYPSIKGAIGWAKTGYNGSIYCYVMQSETNLQFGITQDNAALTSVVYPTHMSITNFQMHVQISYRAV